MKHINELALSGGAARGAFQFAFCRSLLLNGYTFGHISGTSIGAVNAYLLSSELIETGEYIWKEEIPSLFTNLDKLQAIGRGVTFRSGLFSPSKIIELLERFVELDKVKKPFSVYCVDGEADVIEFQSKDITNDDQLRKIMRGAVAIPGIFPPVDYAYSMEGDYRQLIDAGVRALIPPPQYVGQSRMIVTVRNDLQDSSPYPGGSWFSNLLRTYDIMTAEIARGDLETGDLVISPVPILPDPYDFRKSSILKSYRIGEERAQEFIEKDTQKDTQKKITP